MVRGTVIVATFEDPSRDEEHLRFAPWWKVCEPLKRPTGNRLYICRPRLVNLSESLPLDRFQCNPADKRLGKNPAC